jgi:ABC-2 type transport system permease protein
MRKYLAITRATYMIGMIYKFGFIFAILGNIIYLGVAYFLWKSIYANTETLNGLTFDQTFLYVGLGSAIFILLKTYADWIMSFEIREGAIAMYLVKPIDMGLYMLAGSFGSVLLNTTIITIPTILMLLFVFKVQLVMGIGLYLFPISLLLAFLVSFHIDYFVGLICFYSESVWGISSTKEIIVTVFSGALIPLQFFPEAIQKVLYWLPFQAIYHTPLTLITNPDQGLNVFIQLISIQALWVVILFVATRLFYAQAIKTIRVAGG